MRPPFLHNPAIQISEGDKLRKSIDDPRSNSLISDDSSFFLALVDSLELLPHLGVVHCNPETLLQVLETVAKLIEPLLHSDREQFLSELSSDLIVRLVRSIMAAGLAPEKL